MIRRRPASLWRPEDEASGLLTFITICLVIGMLAVGTGMVMP